MTDTTTPNSSVSDTSWVPLTSERALLLESGTLVRVQDGILAIEGPLEYVEDDLAVPNAEVEMLTAWIGDPNGGQSWCLTGVVHVRTADLP